MTVPNQNVIHINREMPKNDGRPFITIYSDHIINAFKDLSYSGLYLYLYFAANRDGYNLEFSPAAVYATTGMPLTTVRDHFKSLVEKGYLVKKKDGSNVFDFYETSQIKNEERTTSENSEIDETTFDDVFAKFDF